MQQIDKLGGRCAAVLSKAKALREKGKRGRTLRQGWIVIPTGGRAACLLLMDRFTDTGAKKTAVMGTFQMLTLVVGQSRCW